jgi:hypothetical protein
MLKWPYIVGLFDANHAFRLRSIMSSCIWLVVNIVVTNRCRLLQGVLKKSEIDSLPSDRHGDGNGLFLLVKPSGARSWIARLTKKGQKNRMGAPLRTDFGLGSSDLVTISEAREKALEFRRMAVRGINPRFNAQKDIPSFAQMAEQVQIERLTTWRSAKHAAQWLKTIQDHAFPKIGALPVSTIGQPEVLYVLAPIWTSKHETARRLFQRNVKKPTPNTVFALPTKCLPFWSR